jgi:hypothetical protein
MEFRQTAEPYAADMRRRARLPEPTVMTSRTQCKRIRHNIKSSIAKASDYLYNPLFGQTFLAFDDWYLAVFMILYSLSDLL